MNGIRAGSSQDMRSVMTRAILFCLAIVSVGDGESGGSDGHEADGDEAEGFWSVFQAVEDVHAEEASTKGPSADGKGEERDDEVHAHEPIALAVKVDLDVIFGGSDLTLEQSGLGLDLGAGDEEVLQQHFCFVVVVGVDVLVLSGQKHAGHVLVVVEQLCQHAASLREAVFEGGQVVGQVVQFLEHGRVLPLQQIVHELGQLGLDGVEVTP